MSGMLEGPEPEGVSPPQALEGGKVNLWRGMRLQSFIPTAWSHLGCPRPGVLLNMPHALCHPLISKPVVDLDPDPVAQLV